MFRGQKLFCNPAPPNLLAGIGPAARPSARSPRPLTLSLLAPLWFASWSGPRTNIGLAQKHPDYRTTFAENNGALGPT
jgi:hypothetical protein